MDIKNEIRKRVKSFINKREELGEEPWGSQKKLAMSFYNNSVDMHNQYYIDKANFRTIFIRGGRRLVTKHNYEETLLELSNNGFFLKKVEDPLNINRKMCEVALCQNIRSLEFVPEDMFGELCLTFEKRYKELGQYNKDKLIVDTILEEIEANGLSLHEMDFSASNKRREDHELSKSSYDLISDPGRLGYSIDREGFKVVENYSSIFYGMSYGEVLKTLRYHGMLLGEVEHDNINLKMCKVAIVQNENALQFVPARYLKAIKNYFNQTIV